VFAFISLLSSAVLPVNKAYADGFQVQGSVKDNNGHSVTGATVDVYTAGTKNDVIPFTTTDHN
jgi:hypothetical protein